MKYLKYCDRLLPISPERFAGCISEEWRHLTQNLLRVLSAGDILIELPSVLDSIRRFFSINGFRCRKRERIALLHLGLAVACCPNLDLIVSISGLRLVEVLVRRPSTIPMGSVELDWVPLHDLLYWLTMSSEARMGMLQCSKQDLEYLLELIRTVKRYFPISCINEVWLKYRHHILERMLHSYDGHAFDQLLLFSPFYPKCFDTISRTWLPDIFDMWYLISDYGARFHDVIHLFSQLACNCRGRIDWEPHMERIFCGLFRAVTQRGDSSSMDGMNFASKPPIFNYYAVLLINSIGPDRSGLSPTVIDRLETFYQAVAPFYHPSNPTVSTALIISFTRSLAYNLFLRLKNELLPPFEQAGSIGLPPAEFSLTVAQVDRLVHLLTHITVDYLLFCKMGRDLVSVLQTIDFLSHLRPRILMPKLLACLEDGMSRPEAPLRYTRPLHALVLCVSSFSYVRFPLFRQGLSRLDDSIDVDSQDEIFEKPEGSDNYDSTVDGGGPLSDAEDELIDEFPNGVAHAKAKTKKDIAWLPSKDHLEALLYREGRCELVRLLNGILTAFDPNLTDRFHPTMACLSRILLSIPTQNYPDDLLQECGLTDDCGLDRMEETVSLIFARILEHMAFVSDRSCVAHSISGGTSSAKTVSTDGYVIQRPYAGPEGHPRLVSDASVLSSLSALSIAIAISAGPNPRFRCQLIRLLIDTISGAHWDPDAARLVAYQLYWLSVNSRPSLTSLYMFEKSLSLDPLLDTSMFALEQLWPHFSLLLQELHSDHCIVYRGHVDPRLLSFLYILPGPLSAMHPSRLVEPEFIERFLAPLITLLTRLLLLSTGGSVAVAQDVLPVRLPPLSLLSTPAPPCPALAEAASGLLSVLIRRLISYSIDLTHFDLMQTGSAASAPDHIFLASPWWTPFISSLELYNQCKSISNSSGSGSDTARVFWTTPTNEMISFARGLVQAFLSPILHRLDAIRLSLSLVVDIDFFSGFSPELSVSDQRDQLSALLIWANNLLTGLADDLAPRMPDTQTDAASCATFPDNFIPLTDIPFFECDLVDILDASRGVRHCMFKTGLELLECIADLFRRVDDDLVNNDNVMMDEDELMCEEDGVNHHSKSPHTVGQLFNGNQIDDLLCFIHTAAFNQTSSEHYPCLLRTTRGPAGLTGVDFGAYSCLGSPPNLGPNTIRVIPFIGSLGGPACSASRFYFPFHTNDPSDLPLKGRHLLAWLASIQGQYGRLLGARLRHPLTSAAIRGGNDGGLDNRVFLTPSIDRLIHAMGLLSTAPRRSDVRLCASGYLTSITLPETAKGTTLLASVMLDRLEHASRFVEHWPILPSMSTEHSDYTNSSLESTFKIMSFRRTTAVSLLSNLFHGIRTILQGDELIRCCPSMVVRALAVICAQAVQLPTNDISRPVSTQLTSSEIRSQQAAHDRLEKLVLNLFNKWATFPLKFVLHIPSSITDLPEPSWLSRVYTEIHRVVHVFDSNRRDLSLELLNPDISELVSTRRSVYKSFLSSLYSRCLLNCMSVLDPANSDIKRGAVAQNVVTRIFTLLPRSLDAPLTPPWLPNVILAAPPPPAPPTSLLATAFLFITSHQPDAARAACDYVIDLLFLMLLRHRAHPIIQISSDSLVSNFTDCFVAQATVPIPAPRRDNTFLLFDPEVRVLASEESFRKHHHISETSIGYVYFPPTIELDDPHHVPPYPIFIPATGELDETKSEWLDHLDRSSDDGLLTSSCLQYLANQLASPRPTTMDFWSSLADRLLYLHRRPSKQLFPLVRFIQVVSASFGPFPLLHHLERFFSELVSVKPGSTSKMFDGTTEIVGCVWLRLGLIGLTMAALKWPRVWKHYFLARVLPRILCIAELNALSISTSGLTQTVIENLHPALSQTLVLPLLYAGSYGGAGSLPENDPTILLNPSTDLTPDIVSSIPQTPLFSIQTVTPTSVSPSQAGGPMNRLASTWELLFSSLCHTGAVDFSLLHPLWEWIQCGLEECTSDEENRSSESVTEKKCGHAYKSPLTADKLKGAADECPTCLLNNCLPAAHRRVFYGRLCATLVIYTGWRGVKLFPYLSKCLSGASWPSNLKGNSSISSSWFKGASDDSVWIRDLAGSIAVFRAAISHEDVFYAPRVPLRILNYSDEDKSPQPSNNPAALKEAKSFLDYLFSRVKDTEPVGAVFVHEVFLRFLTQDTLAVLNLKGYQPSEATVALVARMLDRAKDGAHIPGGDHGTRPSLVSKEHEVRVAIRALTNRLRCMYACLPVMLSHAFPALSCPANSEIWPGENISTVLDFCIFLAPLIADVCSTGDFYKRVSRRLDLGAFGPTGFTRSLIDSTGGEHVDGLESGLTLVLQRFSFISIAGHGDPASVASACLAVTHPFLTHSSWKTRGIGLLLLRNLVVMNSPAFWELNNHNRHIGNKDFHTHETLIKMRELLVNRLIDQWIEICNLAMYTMAVFIQTKILQFDEEWINQLIRKAQMQYPRRPNKSLEPNFDVSQYHNAIRERHSGVLALSAFVLAHPHTTPHYLPAIITELARHVHDPQPIEKTVRNTLTAFSRSHQDTWHEQRSLFTEEQLEEYLSVVSAATYYV